MLHSKDSPYRPQTRSSRSTPTRGLFSLFRRALRPVTLLTGGLLIALGVVMTPLSALAATKTDTLAPGEQAQAFAYYKALRTCLATGWYKASAGITGRNYFEPKDATAFDWFNGNAGYVTNGVNIGAFNDPRVVDGSGQQN